MSALRELGCRDRRRMFELGRGERRLGEEPLLVLSGQTERRRRGRRADLASSASSSPSAARTATRCANRERSDPTHVLDLFFARLGGEKRAHAAQRRLRA